MPNIHVKRISFENYRKIHLTDNRLLFLNTEMVSIFKYRVGQKIRTGLRVDNFATVSGKKACDMSKVSKFCLEKYLNVSEIKYYLRSSHTRSMNLTTTHEFYIIFHSNSESNSNSTEHAQLVQTKFNMGTPRRDQHHLSFWQLDGSVECVVVG